MTGFDSTTAVWGIAAAATLGVIVRPFGWPEAVWAAAGALALVLSGLMPWQQALQGVAKGTDVYFFLVGMMALAEVARSVGLFDSLARWAVAHARGSAARLFLLIYLVAVVVTVLLSNDATAVVMTPAVYAAARAAKARPLPLLLICAFVANAASFVLPISNPANLVVYASHMPSLGGWLARFSLPSAFAIVLTYALLRYTQRKALADPIATGEAPSPWSSPERIAAVGILVTAAVILVASALDRNLGLPTLIAGLATAGAVTAACGRSPMALIRGISWSVLPLVAGLFVIVEALVGTGLIDRLAAWLQATQQHSPAMAGWLWGGVVALLSNLCNNLPTGLLASLAIGHAQVSDQTAAAILIGVDLGPNLSVTGSLATILWLIAIRREGEHIGFLAFLKLGLIVMPPALAGALLALIHLG